MGLHIFSACLSGQGPAPCYGPRGRGGPLLFCHGRGRGARTGCVPTSWGRQRESRQDQAKRREGRRVGCPQKPQATEMGEQGKESMGSRRQKQQRETRREGGRRGEEREENQLHRHDPLPPGGGCLKILSPPTREHLLAPVAGSSPPPRTGRRPGGPSTRGKSPRQKTKPLGPEVGRGAQVRWLCDLRTTSCPLWTPVCRPSRAHPCLLREELSPGTLSFRKG